MLYRCLAMVLALSAPGTHAVALELKFKPSFLELHVDGMAQRVMPGEFVEVPLGDASLEIELTASTPRKIEITSRGESQFTIFGAKSRLGDGGKMVASMAGESKKLDISWTKGEMSTPPGNFDKPAVVAFFTKHDDDLLRPVEFAGVRPFGYTEILEGHRPPSEGELPYFPPPPPQMTQALHASAPSSYAPPSHYELPPLGAPNQDQGWVSYREESQLPPLTLPPPVPPRRETPSQIVYLEPSEAEEESNRVETVPSDEESSEDGADEEEASPLESSLPNKPNQSKTKSYSSSSEPSPAPSDNSSPEGNDETSPSPSPAPRRMGKPTLYQMVMDQEKKQQEFLEKIEEVSRQVRTIKEGGSVEGTGSLPRASYDPLMAGYLDTLTILGSPSSSVFAPLSMVNPVTASFSAESSASSSDSDEEWSTSDFEVEVITESSD